MSTSPAASGSAQLLPALLLAEPAPQLLLLDEPTNNLDLASARELSILCPTRALLVASHDVGSCGRSACPVAFA